MECSLTDSEKKEVFVQAWKNVLNVDSVNDDDNFFEVGGDSIKGVQLVGWLIQKGLKLDMLKIYTAPTVSELVESLEETKPMAVPSEMLTKENFGRFMQDPVVQQAMTNAGGMPLAPQMPQQLCVPPMFYMPQQMCTPQMVYMPPMAYIPQQMCTPQMPQQLCTPSMFYMPQQMCTPQMVYMPPMAYVPQQMCTPQVPQQLCTPPMVYGAPIPYAAPVPMPYMGFPTNAPIQNPNVIQINEPKLGQVTKAPEDALNIVLSGILPGGYNKDVNLFHQGLNSFGVMQLITRCAEYGYRLKIEDVIKNPTFSGIVSNMKTE